MAAPKPQRISTPKVNKATGFTTGTVKTNATKSNPVTTMTPAAQKKAAGVQSAKAFTPAAARSPLDQIGDAIKSLPFYDITGSRQYLGKAMDNPNPVIPFTQKNLANIKKAQGK